MQKNILSQGFYDDHASQQLVRFLEENEQRLGITNSVLYYNFPIFKNIDEDIQYPSLMLICPYHGIFIFQCDNRASRELNLDKIEYIDDELSQIYSFIFSKLIKNKNIRKDRSSLLIDINAAIYAPNINSRTLDLENELIINDSEIITALNQVRNESAILDEILNEIIAVLEGSKGIIKPKERHISENQSNTKGGILGALEKEIANFDKRQKYAALTQLEGPQRIRGLAGSGKTIVLTMKAALIHLRNPDAIILYTFYTKSLYSYIKRLITRFYRQHEDSDPDWKKVHILHGWGGSSVKGVYYQTCSQNNVQPISFREAKNRLVDPFDFVCQDLLAKKNGRLDKVYDYVLMDEAQDFKPSFYQLCRQIVRNDCLVWGYDELQNILNVKIQSTIETFKNEKYGYEGIDLAKLQEQYPQIDNDIVLAKCYRSSREILVLAHAIGFGIYNSTIIQMLENKEHWSDLGYEVIQGDCKEGDHMIIQRPLKNSPLTISEKQKPEELIRYYTASGMTDEVNWVCNSIQNDIENEKLNPEDILVVCIDDKYARKYFARISENLRERDIKSNNVLADIYATEFFMEGCVTLSTVYRAKGNEAAIVYVIGVDTFASEKDSRIARNKLFTAFTRTKAWLVVTGANELAEILFEEIRAALSKIPNLEFIYPNIEEMNVFQRDLADVNVAKASVREKIQELINEAERKGIPTEELLDLIKLEGKK
jgi:superfamily I DNA and RNA helicase